MIPTLYNANYQIFQTPDHFVLLMEMIHEARIVPLDGTPHAAGAIRQWLGDGRGRWEGDTLVVETLHFNGKLDGGDYQPSHVTPTGPRGSGETLRLTERFTLVDANTIDYRVTVEDPQTLAVPYTAAIPMHRSAPASLCSSTPATRATTPWSICSAPGAPTSSRPSMQRRWCRSSGSRPGIPACGSRLCRSRRSRRRG